MVEYAKIIAKCKIGLNLRRLGEDLDGKRLIKFAYR